MNEHGTKVSEWEGMLGSAQAFSESFHRGSPGTPSKAQHHSLARSRAALNCVSRGAAYLVLLTTSSTLQWRLAPLYHVNEVANEPQRRHHCQ
mmetsp:Transcript_7784/g.12803  ORF Transcript_7784/g.12803 Transcript_7784/m.12803 type:complete len:92 (+) Transcript_7784:21-296(+)